MGRTCLNRLIKTCENAIRGGGCKRDYNPNHHPNNYDCRNYHEIPLLEFRVVNKIGDNGNGHHHLKEKTYIRMEEKTKKLEKVQ